jgi:hypothetical protein
MTARRFPPPWTIEELNNACFIVKDASGQKLAYFYFEEEPGRRSAAKLLTKDEARRIATISALHSSQKAKFVEWKKSCVLSRGVGVNYRKLP